MDERYSGVSIIVGAFFFFSFLVFFLVGYDGGAGLSTTVTGATVSLNDNDVADASYRAGNVLSGDLRITLSENDFLPLSYEATLSAINTTGAVVASSTLDLEDLFADTSIVEGTSSGGTLGYGIAGTYTVDIAEFNLSLPRPGTYQLEFSLDYMKNEHDSTRDATWDIVVESTGVCEDDEDCPEEEYCSVYGFCDPILCRTDAACTTDITKPYCNLHTYSCVECMNSSSCTNAGETCSPVTHRCRNLQLPEVYEVLFINYDSLEEYPLSFVAGDTIACVTNVSANTVDLSASFYQPGDATNSPRYVFNTTSFTCDTSDDNFCWVTQKITNGTLGQWACTISAINAEGSDVAVSHRALVMSNTPPEQVEDIDDLLLTEEVMYEIFDLDDYFTDAENDSLGFAWRGEGVSANIDSDHKVGVRGLTDAENGWMIFTVTDGFTEVDSNIVHVNFSFVPTAGTALTDCIEDWQCGEWSAWQTDVRTRLCIDVNACGTEFTKPVEVQQRTFAGGSQGSTVQPTSPSLTTSPEEDTTSWISLLVYIGILVVVLVGAFVLVVYLKRKKALAVNKSSFVAQNVVATKQAVTTSSHVGESQVQQLENYFFSALAHDEQLPAIIQRAQKAGWPPATIEQVKRFVSLKQFVDVKRKQGYAEVTLRKSLLAKGWKNVVIDRVFAMK